MEIKRLKIEHFYELRELLDGVFSRQNGRGSSFAKLFPRIFEKPNEYATSSHLGAFVDGKLIGTAAMYPVDYVVGGNHIRLIGNGNIAVLEEYRGIGVMSRLLEEINLACDRSGDLGYLHGNPVRYGRVGYFSGGIEYLLTFKPDSKCDYVFREATDKDTAFLLKLSESRTDYPVRSESELLPALRSGSRESIAVCRKSGELIGYLSLKRSHNGPSHVEEFAFAEKCESYVFPSLAAELGENLTVRISGYDRKTLQRCETAASVTTGAPALFRIINPAPLENAARSLGLDKDVLYAPYLT